MSNSGEIWKNIEGYEGSYQVSNYSRVRSLDREIMRNGYPVRRKGKILKPALNSSGYWQLVLSNGISVRVHRVVAIAFIENKEGKKYVNHKDGNCANDDLENLEWVTPSENVQHAYDNGLKTGCKGSKNGKAILNEKQITQMKSLIGTRTLGEVGVLFGVKKSYVYDVKSGRTWSHIK